MRYRMRYRSLHRHKQYQQHMTQCPLSSPPKLSFTIIATTLSIPPPISTTASLTPDAKLPPTALSRDSCKAIGRQPRQPKEKALLLSHRRPPLASASATSQTAVVQAALHEHVPGTKHASHRAAPSIEVRSYLYRKYCCPQRENDSQSQKIFLVG
jgi:hypothetical protein